MKNFDQVSKEVLQGIDMYGDHDTENAKCVECGSKPSGTYYSNALRKDMPYWDDHEPGCSQEKYSTKESLVVLDKAMIRLKELIDLGEESIHQEGVGEELLALRNEMASIMGLPIQTVDDVKKEVMAEMTKRAMKQGTYWGPDL